MMLGGQSGRQRLYIILGVFLSLLILISMMVNLWNLHRYHEIKTQYRISTCQVTNCQELNGYLALDLTPAGWPFLSIPTTHRGRKMECRYWNGTSHPCQYFIQDPTQHCSLKLWRVPHLGLSLTGLILTLIGGIPLNIILFAAGLVQPNI